MITITDFLLNISSDNFLNLGLFMSCSTPFFLDWLRQIKYIWAWLSRLKSRERPNSVSLFTQNPLLPSSSFQSVVWFQVFCKSEYCNWILSTSSFEEKITAPKSLPKASFVYHLNVMGFHISFQLIMIDILIVCVISSILCSFQ